MHTPPRPPLRDLDTLPWPARHLLPMERYWRAQEPHGASRGRWANLQATRGCPHNCAFCTSPELEGRRHRARDPERVVDEIVHLVEVYGVEDIQFADDNLASNRAWTEALARAILARGLHITYQLNTGVRVERLDRPLLQLLARSGLRNLTLAPESGSPRVLRELMCKPLDLEAVRRAVVAATAEGIRVCLFFLLGVPGETWREAEQTLDFAADLARLGADEASFGTFTPLPGSALYRDLEAAGRLGPPERFYDDLRYQAEFGGARSWSLELSADALSTLRRRGFRRFCTTIFTNHPEKALRLAWNLLRGRQETKTDRVLQRLVARHRWS